MAELREYETTFVLKPDMEEEAREGIMERVKKIIEEFEGEIEEVDTWGTRKLAYEINDFTSGYYTIIAFRSKTGVVKELERNFKIIGDVLRHLIVRKDV